MTNTIPHTNSIVQAHLEAWSYLPREERLGIFRSLASEDAEDLFLSIDVGQQASLFRDFTRGERRMWIRYLAPDDAADLIQELPENLRLEVIELVDNKTKLEITGLLSYKEDEAGGLMSPRFARCRPDMLVAEAILYVRKQAVNTQDPLHYVYVLDSNNILHGVMSLRQLFIAPAEKKISEEMETRLIKIPDEMKQEAISSVFTQHRFVALPVVNSQNQMKGVVTLDDVLDVSQEEATEDMQKLGGTEALDAPYPEVTLPQMIKKRAGWLTLLFIGEMFTATAMARFEDEIAKAVVLSLFIPLIISSGGNSGSQATSLIIRAMALKELRLKDWWRVFLRELVCGASLGLILASIGMTRIMLWPNHQDLYTQHFRMVALAVGTSLVGVVLFGSLIGSMLPFLLRRMRLDPASASAPLVATLVDVTGLVIYFEVAKMILRGTLL